MRYKIIISYWMKKLMNAICPLWNQMKINNTFLSSMDKLIHPSSQTGMKIYLPNQQSYKSNKLNSSSIDSD